MVSCIGDDFELVLTRVQAAGSTLFICAGYIPPELRSNSLFVKRFADSINRSLDCTRDGDLIVVCGDFNQANLLWKQDEPSHVSVDPNSVSAASACLLDNMAVMDLKQFCAVLNPWNHILDLVFSNVQLCVVTEAAVPLVKIDRPHPPLEISLTISDTEPLLEHEDTPPPDYKRIDFSAFNSFLAQINWTEALMCTDVDTAVQKFSDPILNWLSTNVPKMRPPAKPAWGNSALRLLRREKNACQRHYRRLRTPHHKRLFQVASSAYKNLNSRLYLQYINRMERSLRRNPKRFWKFVNSKRRHHDGVPVTVSLLDAVTSDASEKCELFAKHFAGVFNTQRASPDNAALAALTVPENLCHVVIPRLSEEMIRKAIKKLKSSTAPGPDGIPAVIFKKCVDVLAAPLCFIFNLSLQQHKFPTQWKQSFMFPVYKSGDKRDVRNYRGITSLSAGSKLFETIINDYLFAQTKSYISTDQHGFYPGRSVTTNLLCFTSSCINHLENGKQVDAIYTDLKAAFDKIDHRILLSKLSKLGVSDDMVEWLKSYLCDRRLCVKIGSHASSWFKNCSGVPQGSNLGPLLFALYFNDVAALLGVGCRLIYADDLKIYVVIENLTDCVRLQRLLNLFVKWCDVNCMALSINKCVVISFHRSTVPIHMDYKIGGTTIQRVSQVKDLGILLDTRLTFNSHRSDIIDRANRQLGFLMRMTKDFSDIHCLKTLYTSLVRSIVETSSVVWCPYQACWIERIERIQRRFVRFALRLLPWSDRNNLPPYVDRCCLMGIETLEQRRTTQQATTAAKILNGEIDSPTLLAMLPLNAPYRIQRRTLDAMLATPFHRSLFGYNEPLSAITRAFNEVGHLFDFEMSSSSFRQNVTRSRRPLI